MDITLFNELVEKLKKEVDNGNIAAMVDLADLYYQGPTMNEQDTKRAIPYYIMAAEHGDAYSAGKAGLVLYYGLNGVEKDISKAIKYLEYSADKGILPSMYQMGLIYEYGEVVEQDYEKAYNYYNQASKNGDVDSMFRLAGVKLFLGHDDYLEQLCLAHICGSEEATEMLNEVIHEHGENVYNEIQNIITIIKNKESCT